MSLAECARDPLRRLAEYQKLMKNGGFYEFVRLEIIFIRLINEAGDSSGGTKYIVKVCLISALAHAAL